MAKKINIPAVRNATTQKLQQDEAIKEQIRIVDELRDLIPPLQEDEYRQLEENIVRQGCREPLLLWRQGADYILVDGHNRYSICERHALRFDFRLMNFDSLESAKHWMIENQLGRRNLSPEQASYLRGLRYESEKQENRGAAQVQKKGRQELATAERIAQEHNVSEKTIKRDAKYARGMDLIGRKNPELKKALLAGKVKAKKSDIQALAGLDEASVGSIREPEDIAGVFREKGKGPAAESAPPAPAPEVSERELEEAKACVVQALDEAAARRDGASLKRLSRQVSAFKKLLNG